MFISFFKFVKRLLLQLVKIFHLAIKYKLYNNIKCHIEIAKNIFRG